MWEPVTLPFKNNSHSLPLPTTDEIRACPNILWECYSSKVVAVNDEIAVKFGSMINISEGQALIYLERYVPEVPAPRLYAMFYDSVDLFLVMQRAPGVQLDKIWPSLIESEKDDITTKLRQTFDTLRQAECPWPDFYGSLSGGSVQDYLFYSHEADKRHLGPFYSEDAFVAGLVGNFRALIKRGNRPDFKVRFYETYLARVLQGHRPTLTHGDVQQKNIIVAENTSSLQNNQGGRLFDIVLVDWANSGWYPDFWEFFRAASPINFEYWEDDWCWRAQEILQVWPAELAIMRMIDKDYRGY
ncbi:phosphotransferase enzyme family protein [Arthroderma uncinatum]|uniref:phosphotransferase enzyme family protein n=1 Tax=Arthroderma uncinatum TaxID=74035 RepID=UPI00144A7D06|nr:phosphotransferase enzyme family protein [Arthroderma uncinatum]KAF3490594.1 phosphotransferase enzyme family protein [Arthroderma uncinatum]